MTRLDPEVASAEDAGRQRRQYEQVMRPSTSSSPSLAGGTVPPAPRQHQHQPHSSSLPSSLVLLSTSTTDPSLFSFDTVKKLNQAHLATIPPKPYSAISVAQQKQQQQQSGQVCLYSSFHHLSAVAMFFIHLTSITLLFRPSA